MASTPSASALSAVLRCQGNIWTRNPPTKRPATSAYSLGLSGGSPAERTRSNHASAWGAFIRVPVGRRPTVAYQSPLVDGDTLGKKGFRQSNKLCHSTLSQSAGDARAAGAHNPLVRQLARRLTSYLPKPDKCAHIIHKIRHETCATQNCKIVFVRETSEFSVGVLKVFITSLRLMGSAGQIPSLVSTGWSTLKGSCLSLTALVSEIMSLKLEMLWRSSSSLDEDDDDEDDALQHQIIRNNSLQASGQIHSPTDLTSSKDNSCCGQMIPEDRPD